MTAVGILDDVIIFSEDPSLHVGYVRAILQILRDNKLYAKVEKYEFNKDSMTFFGYMVFKAGIGMDPAKVSAILDWPIPKSVKDVQSFLGFANFYRALLCAKCKGHSLMQRWDGNFCTKASKYYMSC